MTKAEAIAMLKRIQEPEAWEPQINQAAFEALDMAIEALSQESSEDVISRQAAIDALAKNMPSLTTPDGCGQFDHDIYVTDEAYVDCMQIIHDMPSAQPDTEKICERIKAEAIKRNVEYMKHGDRYMIGFVDGMRLARRIVDGTVDDPVYFTTSGE